MGLYILLFLGVIIILWGYYYYVGLYILLFWGIIHLFIYFYFLFWGDMKADARNFTDCRLHRVPFVAKISRQQLFQYLQDCASVMIAFHYAHTDAAHSMLHFDLIIQQDQHLVDHVQHEPSTKQLDEAQSSTSDIQPNGSAEQFANDDAQANGTLPSGRSQADNTQAGVGSNGKDQGVSFKGDTYGKAVSAESVTPLAQPEQGV